MQQQPHNGFAPVTAQAPTDTEDIWLASSPVSLTPESFVNELIARQLVTPDGLARLLGAERHTVDITELEHALVTDQVNPIPAPALLQTKCTLSGLRPMPPAVPGTRRLDKKVARLVGAIVLDMEPLTVAFVDPSDSHQRNVTAALGASNYDIVLTSVPEMQRLLNEAYPDDKKHGDVRPPVGSLWELLDQVQTRSAAELFCVVGEPPALRVQGRVMWLSRAALSRRWLEEQIQAVIKRGAEEAGEKFEREALDGSFVFPYGNERFLFCVGQAQSGPTLRVQILPRQIRDPKDLAIPPTAEELVEASRGLIIIAGPPRSGRSWSALSLVQKAAASSGRHVVTVSDPILSVLKHGRSVLVQRQVPDHVPTHAEGARQAMREGAEVLVLDQVQDEDTARAAIDAARGGLLVIAVVPSNTSAGAFNMLAALGGLTTEVDRTELAKLTTGILCQRLVRRVADGAQVLVTEIMSGIPAVQAALVQNDRGELVKAIEGAWKSHKLRTLEMSAAALVHKNVVSPDEILPIVTDPARLEGWVAKLATPAP